MTDQRSCVINYPNNSIDVIHRRGNGNQSELLLMLNLEPASNILDRLIGIFANAYFQKQPMTRSTSFGNLTSRASGMHESLQGALNKGYYEDNIAGQDYGRYGTRRRNYNRDDDYDDGYYGQGPGCTPNQDGSPDGRCLPENQKSSNRRGYSNSNNQAYGSSSNQAGSDKVNLDKNLLSNILTR